MELPSWLQTKLSNQPTMPFHEYMHYALYDPKHGYYTSAQEKLGAQGDFITAPELTPLFGYTIATQCAEVLIQLPNASILEFGAGTGRLCIDILTHLEKNNIALDRYYIMEVSGNLRHRQQLAISKEIPHLLEKVQWLDSLPNETFPGVILANEVLDAMPVHMFYKDGANVFESHVCLDSNKQLQICDLPCENTKLLKHIEQILPEECKNYRSEVNLWVDGWLQQCFELLTEGVLLILDYGFPAHEYYHPNRDSGTLMCHYQHKAHPNPLAYPGKQDITAHVDFSHVAKAGVMAGFKLMGFTNQAAFLLSLGLLELLGNESDVKTQFRNQQAVKKLLQPHEMGELFKVIALGKKYDFPLTGFKLLDKQASL